MAETSVTVDIPALFRHSSQSPLAALISLLR